MADNNVSDRRDITTAPEDVQYINDVIYALENTTWLNTSGSINQQPPAYSDTPYGARKTAQLNVQFAIDPTFGLTAERYSWYSNNELFDSTFFTERNDGKIGMEPGAVGTDTARLSSAFPGKYIAHTVSEPGVGVRIPQEYIERDANNQTSLTHGEISLDLAVWDDAVDASLTSHGISFESDGTYHQIRKQDASIAKVPQDEWNIDQLDGTGPSGKVLRPEDGFVYNFPYTWYGQGAIILAIEDPVAQQVIPANVYIPDDTGTVDTPNLPIQVTIQNQGTAQPLGAIIGGMQYATHGVGAKDQTQRETKESRITSGNAISTTAVLSNESVDPYAETGYPLVAMRRKRDGKFFEKTLAFEIVRQYLNVGTDCYLFTFDEFDDSALTGGTWRQPSTVEAPGETGIEVNTGATSYTPGPNAVLRGMDFVAGTKNQSTTVIQDASNRVPINSTVVTTAVLAPGSNSTDAEPFVLGAAENF